MTKTYTSCKECIFAVYDGKTQTNCELGRIETYRGKGENVVIEAYDADKEFYLINNFKCNCFRNQNYAINRPGQNHAEEVIKENKTKFCFIITADDDINNTKTTLVSLLNLNYHIEEIVIILNSKYEKDKLSYINMANGLFHGKDVTWRIMTLQSEIEYLKSIDLALHHHKKRFNFFCELMASETFDNNEILKQIDDKINKEINVAAAIHVKDDKNTPTFFTFFNFGLYIRMETPDKMADFINLLESNEEWKKEQIYM